MGVLRVLLALMVAVAHVRPLGAEVTPILGGAVFAVKAFFVISGFYMALVLDGQYRTRPVRSFYLSRFSRILPIYWLVSALAALAEWLMVPSGSRFFALSSPLAYAQGIDAGAMPWWIWLYIGFSLATTIGLDTGHWFGFSSLTGAIGTAPNFLPNAISVTALSAVPTAWTLSIELLFYLIAPFIVRRSIGFIVLLAAGSIAFRVGLAALGFGDQPWNRTLFPSELVFFCGGILAYRLYRASDRVPATMRNFAALAPIAAALLVSPLVQQNAAAQDLIDNVGCVLIALGIPFLFRATRENRLDARIGDLSYPIYISHLFVYGLLAWAPVDIPALGGSGWVWLSIAIGAVLLVSLALDRWVAVPIDAWRQRLGARARPEVAPLGAGAGARSGVPG